MRALRLGRLFEDRGSLCRTIGQGKPQGKGRPCGYASVPTLARTWKGVIAKNVSKQK